MLRSLDEKMLREAALKGLIDRKLLLQGAAELEVRLSPKRRWTRSSCKHLNSRWTASSAPERFDQVIRQLGYSRLQFRQMLAQEMLIGQVARRRCR